MAPLLGESAAMQETRALLQRLAPTPHPVSLGGPSGSGKELAARALHGASGRTGAFVAINCGALGETLAASVLFGHTKGAFTGAVRDHSGAFARAGGGTLFLDEVAELTPRNQAMLLRVLETGLLTPVGAEHEVHVDARTVTATHRDLGAMVRAGTFREDLYHRLRVLEVRMPALAERKDDIALLLRHFCVQLASELGHRVVVSSNAVRWAALQPWPGNVRELRHALIRAAIVSGGEVDVRALQGIHRGLVCTPPAEPAHSAHPGLTASDAPPRELVSVPRGTYRSMHRALLERAVREHGSIRQAARALEVPRSTLGAWLRRQPSVDGGPEGSPEAVSEKPAAVA